MSGSDGETFPSSEFDDWAETYDASVASEKFPFCGYNDALKKVVELARVKAGDMVLDVGTGTGALAQLFVQKGCEVWGIDFSPKMLEKARVKAPSAHFFLQDLRGDWLPELPESFDRIVSAYTFHHFNLDEKIATIQMLMAYLNTAGRLVIADIAFPDIPAKLAVQQEAGDGWEEEYYWVADETLAAMKKTSLKASYEQVSVCAGVFSFAS